MPLKRYNTFHKGIAQTMTDKARDDRLEFTNADACGLQSMLILGFELRECRKPKKMHRDRNRDMSGQL